MIDISRVLYISPEDRTEVVELEERKMHVYKENRNYILDSENRIFNIISCTDKE